MLGSESVVLHLEKAEYLVANEVRMVSFLDHSNPVNFDCQEDTAHLTMVEGLPAKEQRH
jgi:hypothetical protein